MNDPNGLCYFKKYYHVYYQYSKEPEGGLKYWDHFRSKDLNRWEHLGIFLSPDKDFDRSGVYSGSAIEHEGKLYIYYTGNVKEQEDYDYIHKGRQHNTVLATSVDAVNIEDRGVVLFNKDYPADLSCNVRDPKVFAYDGKFYMVLGARSKSDKGQVLVYESEDLYIWNHINTIKTDYDFGYMWECPDLFYLDKRWVLLLSPQGIERGEYQAQNVYSNGYFLLDGDFRSEYRLSEYRDLDFGFDFYACQTFEKDDKRYLLAWMGMPDAEYTAPTIAEGWQHAMTCFRQLSIADNRLIMKPVGELDEIFDKPETYKIEQRLSLELKSRACDIRISDIKKEFDIDLFDTVNLRYEQGVLKLIHKGEAYGRTVRNLVCGSISDLRILLDNSSVEVFVNEGLYSMTSRYYKGLEASDIIELSLEASLSIAFIKEDYKSIGIPNP